MAAHFDLKKQPYGNGVIYNFSPSWENGWIMEMHPAEGLFVGSAWFTPAETLTGHQKALYVDIVCRLRRHYYFSKRKVRETLDSD